MTWNAVLAIINGALAIMYVDVTPHLVLFNAFVCGLNTAAFVELFVRRVA